jgi:hypothetical protein
MILYTLIIQLFAIAIQKKQNDNDLTPYLKMLTIGGHRIINLQDGIYPAYFQMMRAFLYWK